MSPDHGSPTASTSTANATSPDSGVGWTTEGAWKIADGVYRMPLPLPMDGLRAVNIYAIPDDHGITLIDGGWAIPDGLETLRRSLAQLGAQLRDVRRIFVTHIHRDHYTLASVLGHDHGAQVMLGAPERPVLELAQRGPEEVFASFRRSMTPMGGAELMDRWVRREDESSREIEWRMPDRYLHDGDEFEIGAGTDLRTLRAVHTPGHTPGHMIFADLTGGLLFTGDHVLPTITPSIGFTEPVQSDPLRDFLASLRRVLELPDLQMLPAHGPVGVSSHTRAAQLIEHHELRLAQTLAALDSAPHNAFGIAGQLTWTRHERAFDQLRPFDQILATRETHAHLDVLAHQGQARRHRDADGSVRFSAQ